MQRRHLIQAASLTAIALALPPAHAQGNTFKIGLVLPMTGQQATTGRQIEAAARLYMAQNGDTVAGKKIELIIKDDTSLPDVTKRLAQELVVNDKVNVLAGFGITPSAMATAPIATQSKTPMVVMAAATSSITEASPYIVRTSFTLPQVSVAMGDWAPKNGVKSVVTLVTDYGPGNDAEKYFAERFTLNGGKVIEKLRVPLRNPDFAPFLQKVRDAKPDALFVFVPSGAGAAVMKQFIERGMDKAGIKMIATGDVTDDDQLNDMGDGALGVVTTHHYSAAHPSAMNKKFVEAFQKANKNMRPNFMAMGGYDGMRVIYEALKATKGQGGGDALLAAMKGQLFESPRGQVLIDAQTRDIVQDVYLRKVEKKDGQLYNVEFDVIKAVKDPGKEISRSSDRAFSALRAPRTHRAGCPTRANPPMLTILFDGIAYGMLLFVLAVGLAVTLGLMNFINLAHGAFAMAGGYLTVFAMQKARRALPGLPAARLHRGRRWLGALLERTLYRPMYGKPHLDQVLFSIGLAFMAVAAIDYFVGSSQQNIHLPEWLRGRTEIGDGACCWAWATTASSSSRCARCSRWCCS